MPKQSSISETHPLAAGLHVLSPCSVHYLQAIEDPFSLKEPVCIPDLHAVNSKKVRVLQRGQFATSGTTGVGWIFARPSVRCNDVSVATSTSSSYDGSSATVISTTSLNINNTILAKVPYSASEFGGDAIQARTVGFGLRIRYMGPELYMGGQVVALRIPDNGDALGKTTNNLYSYSQAKTFPVTRDWISVMYKPAKPSEFEYGSLAGSPSSPSSLVIAINGTTGVTNLSATFEFELITHLEFIGEVDALTLSHSNINDMSLIRNATMVDRPTTKPHNKVVKALMSIGNDVLHSASPMIQQSVMQGASNMFVNGLQKAGTNAISYLRRLPAQLERGAMTALRKTFSGGLLTTLEEASPLLLSLL